MRVEVGQAGRRKGILENLSDWAGATPMLPVEARCLEMPGVPDHDFRRGEQRIVEPPDLLPPQVIDPVDDDLSDNCLCAAIVNRGCVRDYFG
jgi:hypothetical protein